MYSAPRPLTWICVGWKGRIIKMDRKGRKRGREGTSMKFSFASTY